MKEKKLILLGCGDFAREIMYAALEHNGSIDNVSWRPIAFIDNNPNKIDTNVEGLDVFSLEQANKIIDKDVYFISAIGLPKLRKVSIKKVLDLISKVRFATVIHRSAIIMPNVKIEDGVYIGPNATVAIGCYIKSHVALNFNVSIGHDCVIDEYSVVSPGCLLSGHTEIGKGTFLGSGVITYPGVKIGENCAISAGVTVARNIAAAKKMIPKPSTMIVPMEESDMDQ